jgi:hypothetical protein
MRVLPRVLANNTTEKHPPRCDPEAYIVVLCMATTTFSSTEMAYNYKWSMHRIAHRSSS